ncbi:MAG: SAM-dependent methyltransferase [Micromonosporaceae bacterium]
MGDERRHWLGGKDNYAADREAGDQAIRANPDLVSCMLANRGVSRPGRALPGR